MEEVITSIEFQNQLRQILDLCYTPCANESFERLLSFIQDDIRNDRKEKVYPWLVLCFYFYKVDNFDKAIECAKICDSIPSTEEESSEDWEVYHFFPLLKSVLFVSLARLFAVKVEEDLKQKSMDYYLKYNKGCINRIDATSNRRTFYSFRRINEYTLSDLISNSITVMHPSTMNDTVDSLVIPWGEQQIKSKKAALAAATTNLEKQCAQAELSAVENLKESYKHYRIRSFSVNISTRNALLNTLMWAHYSGDHKGVAVEYLFSDTFLSSTSPTSIKRIAAVEYVKPKTKIDISGDSIELKTAFLKKSNEWEYENEYRILSYDTSSSETHLQIPIDSESRIRAIYFGDKCTKQNIQTVVRLFENMKKTISYARYTHFYKMEIDPTNVYVMKPVEINKQDYL